MNHAVWQPVLEKLPEWIEAEAIDLPGHGSRTRETFNSLNDLSDDIVARCQRLKQNHQPLVLVGWSLGGLACLQAALKSPLTIDALVLVSTSPCFIAQDDWRCGVDGEVFEKFAESLKGDFSGTIRRFLSLQVKGSESGRIILRTLREKILQQTAPNEKGLDAGLNILKKADLREQLSKVTQPNYWVLGEQDGLVKSELSYALKDVMNNAEVNIYSKAGHAPFLSHTNEFVQQLVEFIDSSVLMNNPVN